MQPTGNKDPMTGKDEYLAPDGVSKVYLAPEEFTQLSSMANEPQKMPDSAFVQPGRLGNFGVAPIPETPAPIIAKPMAAPPPTAPIATGPIVDDSGAAPVPLAVPAQPAAPVAPTMAQTTESLAVRKNVSPALSKKQDEATKAMENAIIKESDANAAVAEAQAQSAMATAVREKQFVEAEQVKQAKEQQMVAERQAKLDAISDEYSNMKIDSNNYWSSKSTGDSILAALAIGLGTFADVASGTGESRTLKILQSKIDQDIEIQKANMAKAGQNVDTQRGLYSDIVRQIGDERLARLKTHELGINAAKAEFAAIAAKSGNELVKAKAAKDIAALDQALAQNKIEQAGTIQTQVKTAPVAATQNKTLQSINEDFGKEMVKYVNADRKKALGTIEKTDTVLKMIADRSGGSFNASGRFIGRIPDVFKPEANKQIKAMADAVAIEGMADAFGPQFTEKEGTMFRQMSYDETISPEENIERLKIRQDLVRQAMLRKDRMFDDFVKNGYSIQGVNLMDSGASKVKSFKTN